MSNASSVTELPSFGRSPLGGKLSSSESDFSGSESLLLLNALVAGDFLLLFSGVAWSSGVPANRFIAFYMDSMVELIWVMADNTSASTSSVPWCEELADSFASESRFSSAGERGSLPLIVLAVMLQFSQRSLNTERAKQYRPSQRIAHN